MVFTVDVLLPVEIAAGVGYVLAVAVSFGTNVRGFPIAVACCCSVLLLIGYGLRQAGTPTNDVLANQFLALFAIWVTAVLTSRLQNLLLAEDEEQEQVREQPPAETPPVPAVPIQPAAKATSEKASEEATGGIRDRDMLESLLKNIPDNIYFKDYNGHYLRVSRSKAERSGLLRPEEAVGKTDFDFFSPGHAQKARRDEEQILETGKPLVAMEEKLVWANGQETWSSTTKVPLCDRDGNVAGTLGISRDITKQAQPRKPSNAANTAFAGWWIPTSSASW